MRAITQDNTIIDAMRLNPPQLEELLECVNQNIHITGDERRQLPPGTDGTKVPQEQLFNPPPGILPRVLTEEERRQKKEWTRKENERINQVLADLENEDGEKKI